MSNISKNSPSAESSGKAIACPGQALQNHLLGVSGKAKIFVDIDQYINIDFLSWRFL